MHPGRALVVLLLSALPLGAQTWNDPRVLDMVRQATDRRVQQLSDSGLLGYQAAAHGYVTFLAQLGEGFRTPPKVVKADELALEVYWRAPNLSKQRIVGRRDTTLLPTDIAYHTDHLGIVQNNFPAIIRLGDGDEVSDVRHPLSGPGMLTYEYALSDSLRIAIPGRAIEVYEVRVRPKDDRLPGVIGAVYLDRADGRVVRMAFNFTQASFVDRQLEDVSIVLENGLVDGRFWLPRRQEVEIRRKVQWLDYPARGIIRGRWDIGDYQLNVESESVRFIGPEVVLAPPATLKAHPWPTPRLVDSLPEESQIATPEEIRRVQESARQIVRQQVVRRARMSLAANGASDFIRFDRANGLTVGAGFSFRTFTGGPVIAGHAMAPLGPGRASGELAFDFRNVRGMGLRISGYDKSRSAGDVTERSAVVNSLAAQEFGSDYTDYFLTQGGRLELTVPLGGLDWNASVFGESQSSLPVRRAAFAGRTRPAFDAHSEVICGLAIGVSMAPRLIAGIDAELRSDAQFASNCETADVCTAGPPAFTCGAATRGLERASLVIELRRDVRGIAVSHRTFAGVVSGGSSLRTQDLFFLGGPVSAPGYDYHALVGDRALSQSLEVQLPVPFPRIPLGRFGGSPRSARLAPHWSAAWLHRVDSAVAIHRSLGATTATPDPFRATPTGWHQSVGVGLIAFFDLLRFDVSRAIPSGRWIFSVDVTRAFWGIL